MKKKISLIGIGLAVILIPTFIMLSFYFSNRDIPVEIRQAEKMELQLPDGKSLTASVDGDYHDLLTLFCEMTLDAKSVEKLPEEQAQSVPYRVKFSAVSSSLLYRFYFSENPAYCYFVAPDKSVHRIDTEKAKQFLSTDQSEWVYTYATAPTVKLFDTTLPAVNLEWQYRRCDGSYHKASCSGQNQAIKPLDLGVIGGELKIDCTPTPDSILITAVDETGEQIFSGSVAQFAELVPEKDLNLTLTLQMEWKKDKKGNAPFAGKAEYTAKAEMYPPAEFFISKNEIRPGEVFTLSGVHVTDPSAISVEILPKVDFTPHFVYESGNVYALMALGFPTSYMTDSEYQIKINSPDLSNEAVLTVKVKKPNYTTFRDYVKKDVLDKTYSQESQEVFWQAVGEILAKESRYSRTEEKLTFTEGVQTPDTSRYYGYGTSVTIMANGAEYRALDTMYCVYSASKPTAVAEGTVISVTETALSGKMLTIDHGNGIRSWYCNLKEITVQVGDKVEMGQVIGVCQGDGFNGQGGLNMHVALTLGNQALDLKIAIEDGIQY